VSIYFFLLNYNYVPTNNLNIFISFIFKGAETDE